jgi:glycosyltransferase involved in cell wall biosynthesis
VRILFVAAAESIHTARWIAQLVDAGWDLHLFPSIESDEVHADLTGVTVLKGYQTWAGRALVALRALERCVDLLKGRELAVFSPSYEVAIAAELFEQRTGVTVRLIPHRTAHREILAMHARARVYVGLSISDAISLSLLEAMAMGAFPVQSCTSCAEEWTEDGRTGVLVPPDDVDVVEEALRRALSDDSLVDEAAVDNWATVTRRLDWYKLREAVVDAYKRVGT